ncbi:hypothetical protein [Lysinibacillus sp. TE18511]
MKLSNLLNTYMDEVISKEVYLMKSRGIEEAIANLKVHMEPLQPQLQSTISCEVSYEKVYEVLGIFCKTFTQD